MPPEVSKVEQANIANMLAKLKAGRVLTETEERRLKEYEGAARTRPETGATHASSMDSVAAELGLTARQWATYSKRPGFPPKGAQGWDLAAIAAWKEANIKPPATGELAALKAEKIKREIVLADLKIAEQEKKTIPRAAVDELHGRLAQRLRSYLYAKLENEMPPKMAGCDALQHRIYGRELADEIVTTLARDVEQWTSN